MGDTNQLIYVQKYAGQLNGPYLEIGSKNYGNTQNLRPLFAGKGKYVGVDMENGPGVDVVVDLTEDFERIDAELNGERFATIFCFSVLEHCENPFKMADNMTSLLQEGGRICVGVPFSWKVYAYPTDYWRFTYEGVKRLFPKLEFCPKRSFAATSRDGEFQELDDELGKISFSFSRYRKKGQILRGIFAGLLKLFARLGLLGRVGAYRHVFAPTNLLVLGELKARKADTNVFPK